MDCYKGQMVACSNVGRFIEKYSSDPDKMVKTAALYRKARDGRGGVKAARTKRGSTLLYKRGCDFGAGPSCYNAGLIYLVGYNAPRRTDIALSRFARGCGLREASGCGGAARR